ncbi:hypothetical protein KIF24_01775 [Micromonospora sp. Llam7]|uniref:hypothetical protein n=1 Tax=Micromonospora tarapacensis TaxID=2835305 RepID=UPI001C8376C5|nr:hypothetical protein [Micromonospora tarapacensis]MBX7264903.1 hypothetical protein [Micromonospora tarapacensis]
MTGQPDATADENVPVVLRMMRRGMWVYVRVDYAALYGTVVEISGQRLSEVSGGPLAPMWATVDLHEIPGLVVGDARTWTPPAGGPAT